MVIGLPLIVDGAAIGVLTLYVKEPNFFNEEELMLLNELACDISFALDHIAKEATLRYLAYYDALTELPNRPLFQERLTSMLHTARQTQSKVAVVLWDVNRLRYINDTFGRHVGDATLREVGRRLKQVSPDPESVARISADEFSSVLSNVKDASDVAYLLEKPVTDALRSPIMIERQELGITVTAGISLFPSDGDDAETLCRNAEAALNQAKEAGERYLFYQPEMNASVAETLSLERKMRKALDAEQFVLHYQPKIDLADGRISGLEALIRWHDPESGLMSPAKFIKTSGVPRHGCQYRHRRLRNRLFVAGVSRKAPGKRAQNRPFFHHRHGGESRQHDDRFHHHRPRTFAQPEGHRGRGGIGRAVEIPEAAQVR